MMKNLLLLLAASSLALAQTTETSASNTVAPGFGTSTTATGPATSSETASSSENAPVTHTVDVGLAGHTFQPDVTLANVGDIVEFNFFPTNHSVIRADYLRPCVPYEMTGRGRVGFNSDFLPVDAILEDPPKWSIIVNDTNPIFYYCGADGSCINWQMVGVINPNATTSLQKQKDAAKDSTFMLLPGQKWPDEATDPMGTGTGADSSPTETGSSSPATSTGAESSTPTSSSGGGKSLSTGAIAGIAVAGTVAVIGVAALLFFCGRASRKRNNAAAQQQPLMHQQGPFSPQAPQGHMSYVQPYHDLNKHMSVQSHQMHSPALPGYIPPQGETGPQTPGQPLYGPSDALNPGAEYAGSPAQSPNMGAVGMAPAPAYTQRNSMHPQPYSPGSQSPYQPHPSPHQYPQHGNFHEMPAAPVPDSQYQEHGQGLRPHGTPQGGSELSGSDTLGRGQTPPPGTQGAQGGGGIMNFIKQNTGGR